MSFEAFVLLTLNSGFFAQIGCFLENLGKPASLIDGKKLQLAGVNFLYVGKKNLVKLSIHENSYL